MHTIRNLYSTMRHFMQAIAVMGSSCRLGQSDHAKSEHLPGGRNRAAAAMPLRFTSAMQTRTQDATPEPAKQTGCQRAPGKVQLRLDLIQRAPCFTMQPTRISRQNQPGLTRPITIPSAPPMLRLQLRFRNGYFAKHLQPFRNCNASKCNCSTFKATQLVAMQFQAMQGGNQIDGKSNICPRTPQQAGAKANADSSTSPSETRRGQSIQT